MNKESGFGNEITRNTAPGGIFARCTTTLVLLVASVILALNSHAGTLLTDKSDYVPGEHVTFSGTGWQPGEHITIDIYETSADPSFWVGTVSVITQPDGTFSNG